MLRLRKFAIGLALLFLLNSLCLHAEDQTSTGVQQIRQKMEQMRQEYEQRPQKLEERLNQLAAANPSAVGALAEKGPAKSAAQIEAKAEEKVRRPPPDPLKEAGFNKSSYDFRLYDFKLSSGTGELGLTYSRATSRRDAWGKEAPKATGFAVNFIHTSKKVAAGNSANKFSLQYGQGPGKTFTSGFETYTTNPGTFIRPDPAVPIVSS